MPATPATLALKTASGMLGHFSSGFTLDTYAHITSPALGGADDGKSAAAFLLMPMCDIVH